MAIGLIIYIQYSGNGEMALLSKSTYKDNINKSTDNSKYQCQ